MERYICIHGHFYQPPRENPWLEEIELQDSAYPYRNWNERITAECYAPNTASRIVNRDGKIIDIVSNYSKISFNFGPTLLSWLEAQAPDIYQSIIKADIQSRRFYSGHGSAIAQVYNHMIMPLADSRDKKTQILWGIEDFRFRFGRDPEGMWLAETAVDYETLDLLAASGIRFTILAPNQAKRIRMGDHGEWIDVSQSQIDPRKAYSCKLPSGRSISLFFYDGPISHELAFGDLLKNGSNLSRRLAGAFRKDDEPQLVHIATDGETYGHHQKHGDMALAYGIHDIEENHDARITVYGEYLEKYPPQWSVEIVENSSWSCSHGVERWRSNCGCNTGRGWQQEWRKPLREALDWLRDQLSPLYERAISGFGKDPWFLRDEYIHVILNREMSSVEHFFVKAGLGNLPQGDRIQILKYLEMERHAMLMYTSCGWFFDEISGIETVQVIMYAGRAIQLARELTGQDFEDPFMKLLEKAESNLPEVGNGAYAYQNYVKPAVIDLFRVTAHYAISTLFQDYIEKAKIFCYEVRNNRFEKLIAGKSRLVKGIAQIQSRITYEATNVTYAVVHIGDQNVVGGVRESISDGAFEEMDSKLTPAFQRVEVAEIVLLLDKYFGTHNYTFWHLFKDESRKVFGIILKGTLEEIEQFFRRLFETNYPILQAMVASKLPLPDPLRTAVEFVLNTDIRNVFEKKEFLNEKEMERILTEVNKWSISLDMPTLSHAATLRISNCMEKLALETDNVALMKDIEKIMKFSKELKITANLWNSQNILFLIHQEKSVSYNTKAKIGDERAQEWVKTFDILLDYFDVKLNVS